MDFNNYIGFIYNLNRSKKLPYLYNEGNINNTIAEINENLKNGWDTIFNEVSSIFHAKEKSKSLNYRPSPITFNNFHKASKEDEELVRIKDGQYGVIIIDGHSTEYFGFANLLEYITYSKYTLNYQRTILICEGKPVTKCDFCKMSGCKNFSNYVTKYSPKLIGKKLPIDNIHSYLHIKNCYAEITLATCVNIVIHKALFTAFKNVIK